jgi:hypothetical protein
MLTDSLHNFTRQIAFIFEGLTVDAMNSEEPIREVLRYHKILLAFEKEIFSPSEIKAVTISFEKGLNTDQDKAAKLLAHEIDESFRTHPSPFDEFLLKQFISLFRMIISKDVFKHFHLNLLIQRVILKKNHILILDQNFVSALTDQCGPEYTSSFNSIFDDIATSIKVLKQFQSEKSVPPFFSIIVLSKIVWENPEPKIFPHSTITNLNNQFSLFYRNQVGNRILEFNLSLTRASLELALTNGPLQIRCCGLYATLFLFIDTLDPISINSISSTTGIPAPHVEKMIHFLASPNCGRLLSVYGNKIRLNFEANLPEPFLKTPFTFPEIVISKELKTKNNTAHDRGSQFDAVMKILKQEKSLTKKHLENAVKDVVTFRLPRLEVRGFIKIDPSGHIHYLD